MEKYRLYRRFARIMKDWPTQQRREFRFHSMVVERMKKEFRKEDFNEEKVKNEIKYLELIQTQSISKQVLVVFIKVRA